MDIKLFVSCHRPTTVPQHPLLVPVQVGAALAKYRFPGFLQDDAGDNISAQNRSYCELTAQYWAWKNIQADYYGFFHYRRYLYPRQKTKVPYQIDGKPTLARLNHLNFEQFSELIPKYDVVLPIPEDMHMPVWKHYAKAPFHHEEDLALIEEIVQEMFPEYKMAAESYLSGTHCYFGNIFIMKREPFFAYCTWLFSILEEFDRRANINSYGPQEQRVDGYLAERLLGIWVTAHEEFRILELPRVHFIENSIERYKKRVINAVLPPGSKRRSKVKNWKG